MQFGLSMFARHYTSTFFILLYFAWWGFICNFFTSGSAAHPHSCGAANGGAIMLTFVLFISYFVVLIIRIAMVKTGRSDYYVFLGLVTSPLVASFIYLS